MQTISHLLESWPPLANTSLTQINSKTKGGIFNQTEYIIVPPQTIFYKVTLPTSWHLREILCVNVDLALGRCGQDPCSLIKNDPG